MPPLLEGLAITKYFGGLPALINVNFKVEDGEILALIGPNGAGKTTLFNVISGILQPDKGRILFNGNNITGLQPHKICRLGIARTLQIPRPFSNMTALDNVIAGAIFGRSEKIGLEEAREKAASILDFVGLKKDMLAKNLNLHERKRLELARALATDPRVILIDEYMGGLNPSELKEAMNLLRRVREEQGVTIFWVEHVMRAVMGLAERIIVLNLGVKIAEGEPKEIARDANVIEAYLGGGVASS